MLWFVTVLIGIVAANRHDYADTSVRIVGGKAASEGTYAAYGIPVGNMLCGGTLIAPDIMVSAAHCKGAFTAGPSSVAFGGTTISASNAKEIIGVQYEVIHPGYIEATAENDIMIVVLARPSHSKPAVLNADLLYPIDGQSATAIGFGNTAEGGQVSEHLREVKTNIVSPEICSAAYGQISIEVSSDIMLCTGVFGGGKGSCQGDSGGPIFDQDGLLIGVVSWGKGCASATYPGVNARISAYAPFLEDAICSFSQHSTAFCQAIHDKEATPVEDWFSNVTKPEDGWTHAVSQNVSTTDNVWNISRPLILTDAIALDKSVSADPSNSTDPGWQNATNITGLDGFFTLGNDNATLFLESQTFNSSNTTMASFFGHLNDTNSNTTASTESDRGIETTGQSDTNSTDAITDPVNNTTEGNLEQDDRQQTFTGFGSNDLSTTPDNNQTAQNSSMEVYETIGTEVPQISPIGEVNNTETIALNSTATNVTITPATSSSFSTKANSTDSDMNSSIPSPSPTGSESVEQFKLPSLKSQPRDGKKCYLVYVIVAIFWCAVY